MMPTGRCYRSPLRLRENLRRLLIETNCYRQDPRRRQTYRTSGDVNCSGADDATPVLG